MADKANNNKIVVEGPEIICRAITDLLKGDMTIVGEAHGPAEALELTRKHSPCLLVKEAPKAAVFSGEEAEEIRKASSKTNIALISDNPSPQKAREALQAGAKAYLSLEEGCERIKEGLKAAARGEAYIDPKIAAQIAREEAIGSPSRLTAREQEVLKETALGYTSTETGERLYMSKRTVESHRAKINYKLGFHNRAELVGYALREQIIP